MANLRAERSPCSLEWVCVGLKRRQMVQGCFVFNLRALDITDDLREV